MADDRVACALRKMGLVQIVYPLTESQAWMVRQTAALTTRLTGDHGLHEVRLLLYAQRPHCYEYHLYHPDIYHLQVCTGIVKFARTDLQLYVFYSEDTNTRTRASYTGPTNEFLQKFLSTHGQMEQHPFCTTPSFAPPHPASVPNQELCRLLSLLREVRNMIIGHCLAGTQHVYSHGMLSPPKDYGDHFGPSPSSVIALSPGCRTLKLANRQLFTEVQQECAVGLWSTQHAERHIFSISTYTMLEGVQAVLAALEPDASLDVIIWDSMFNCAGRLGR